MEENKILGFRSSENLGLNLGRRISVADSFFCHSLNQTGSLRVFTRKENSTARPKSLFQQRVTDMDFFAQDVHLLASASTDGRVCVWNITEGSDEEDKPQITGKTVIAVQITGEGESVNPRVCWHCHKQDILVVGIGKRVLKIDTTVGRGEKNSAEEPLICPVDKLIDGVQLVGSHDGEVTDLSMCQWWTTRLASASLDGTVKIWEDLKSPHVAVICPYLCDPVHSVSFLAAPHRPYHIVLITGGQLNREMKIWVPSSKGGWLRVQRKVETWVCNQILELTKSKAPAAEYVFFNQVVALSQSGLLLLANSKGKAIYALHLEYGPNPALTCFDCLSEYSVSKPVLSFKGTADELNYKLFTLHSQAIHVYQMAYALPPPGEVFVEYPVPEIVPTRQSDPVFPVAIYCGWCDGIIPSNAEDCPCGIGLRSKQFEHQKRL